MMDDPSQHPPASLHPSTAPAAQQSVLQAANGAAASAAANAGAPPAAGSQAKRKHTGERPFACHCGKQFSRLDNLRQHAQTVHSDKHTENEIMMRELTTLHTQLAARSTKVNRETQAEKRRASNNAAASAGMAAGDARPGTSTGYEGQGQYPPPAIPGPLGVGMPYHHQMPQYPPPPPSPYGGLPPTGHYPPSQEYSGYYPPHGAAVTAPQQYSGYSPQYPPPYPSAHGVRYAPYPAPAYPTSASGPYNPSSAGYADGQTSSPGPHTPLTPSSTTPLSATSAGQGQSFLGSGPPSATAPGGGSFLGPPGAGPGPIQTGSPAAHDPNSAHTPVDADIQRQQLTAPTQSFRNQHLHSPVPVSPSVYSANGDHANGSAIDASSTGGGGSGFGPHSKGSPDGYLRDQQRGPPPDDYDTGFDGRSIGGSSSNGNVEQGFRERGAGSEPGFGHSNSTSRDIHQRSAHQYSHDGRSAAGFNGAAGRGEQYGRSTTPTAGGSGSGFDNERQYSKDSAKEISPTGFGSRRIGDSRKANAPGTPTDVGFQSEGVLSSQRGSRLGVPPRHGQWGDESFRYSRTSSNPSLGGSHSTESQVSTPATGKAHPILPPIAAIVSDESPSSAPEHQQSFRNLQPRPYGDQRADSRGGPPGSSGGFAYLDDSEYGRPGTAPASYLADGGARPGSRSGGSTFRFGAGGPDRLGQLPSGYAAGEKRVSSSRGGRSNTGDAVGGFGARRSGSNAPPPLPGPVNTQFNFTFSVSGRNRADASPVNDSPFTFHPPDVPFQSEQPRDASYLNLPRPTSGRPFSGVSSVGGTSPFSNRPSTSGSAFGRPQSSSGFGFGYGVRPGTATSTTDPASYAFSRGTKRPYTADSSDGGSVNGRDSTFRFGGRERGFDRPSTATADDDGRPPSRRLSLMELCTPPATASGRPRTGGGLGPSGTFTRTDSSDAGTRWTRQTSVDERDELESESSPASRNGQYDGLRRLPTSSPKGRGLRIKPEYEEGPTDVHSDADVVSGEPDTPTGPSDFARSFAREQPPSGFTSSPSELRRSPYGSGFAGRSVSDGFSKSELSSRDHRDRPGSYARQASSSPHRFEASRSSDVGSPYAAGRRSSSRGDYGREPQSLLPSASGSRRSSASSVKSPSPQFVRTDDVRFSKPNSDSSRDAGSSAAEAPRVAVSGKPRNARVKRALAAREPKEVEDPRTAVFVKGTTGSEVLNGVMKDLLALKKPHAIPFSKKNTIRPFEDTASLDFWADKNDASLFVCSQNTKKRPNDLIFARMFDHKVLDMIELGVENFVPMVDFKTPKAQPGIRPVIHFGSELFDTHPRYMQVKSLFLDFFNGSPMTAVSLAGLEYVISITLAPTPPNLNLEDTSASPSDLPLIHFRCYTVRLLASGVRTPRTELVPMGPSLDLRLRRHQDPDPEVLKQAMKQPKLKKADITSGLGKKVKNKEVDEMGDVRARIHLKKQNLDKLQTRKMKGLKPTQMEIDEASDSDMDPVAGDGEDS
ncbi:rRNA-binding ribosome biosynthesis protein rpf2 [Tulasnella sp. 417]|nr:rRNA-binding ribosome biosynthesis protein rpf2 [Tulasnella sp. 417]